MDQPGLVHHDMLHHEHQSLHDQHLKPPEVLRPPKITLRSMSKSDPNLSVPHLIMSQDEEHPSLNRIVSGLFHVNNALRTPVPSYNHLQEQGDYITFAPSHNQLTTSESSASLLGEPQATPTLRKSSSAIDWNGAVAEATRKNSNQLSWQTVSLDAHPNRTNFSQFEALPEGGSISHINEPNNYSHLKQGGLVMSTSTDHKGNMSMVASQIPSQGHFAQGLAASQQTSQATTSNPLDQHVENHDRKGYHGGVFGNVFRQGFFSRPVVRSEDENYRYLMALDR